MTTTWVADPTLSWTIALQARLSTPVDHATLGARLAGLALTSEVLDDDTRPLLETVTAPGRTPLRAATSGPELAFGAQHASCDGLGLLAVLAAAAATDVTSSARGVGDRLPRTSGRAATVQRLREVLIAPPATVAPAAGEESDEDTFVRCSVSGRVGVAELTYAAIRAVQEHNEAYHRRGTRIAVAIGASRTGGAAPSLGDHSALLRVRGVEDLTLPALRDAIRSAAPEPAPPGSDGATGFTGAATTVALGVLSRRLGSTLLISHLGEVQAPGVDDLSFYPVTGGGSGVSIGAAGIEGRTVITVRGRRRRHGPRALEELARRVRHALPSGGLPT